MVTTWWSGYQQQVRGGAKTQCQLDSERRCIIFVPGGPISQSEALHGVIIKNVDIKGGKQPEFVIEGDLAELQAFVAGTQVALHIAIQPPPCVIGGRVTQRHRS